jgi:hypothetical protein
MAAPLAQLDRRVERVGDAAVVVVIEQATSPLVGAVSIARRQAAPGLGRPPVTPVFS